jgi:hypothetical protein
MRKIDARRRRDTRSVGAGESDRAHRRRFDVELRGRLRA